MTAGAGYTAAVEPRASWAFRALVFACRIVARGLAFDLRLEGAENLPRTVDGRPAGGWIAAGLPHRTWIEPFVLVMLLPVEPRIVFLGDGRAIFRSRLRRWIFRVVGGVVPIWPAGGREAFGRHVDAAVRVTRGGAVFGLFPEVGPPSPPDRARRLSAGIGYFALRSGVPTVPLVLGGTGELYRGRRMILRVLPALSPRELAGLAPGEALPAPGSTQERRLAHVVRDELERRTAAAVAELNALTEPAPGTRKRWRWLTTALH